MFWRSPWVLRLDDLDAQTSFITVTTVVFQFSRCPTKGVKLERSVLLEVIEVSSARHAFALDTLALSKFGSASSCASHRASDAWRLGRVLWHGLRSLRSVNPLRPCNGSG